MKLKKFNELYEDTKSEITDEDDVYDFVKKGKKMEHFQIGEILMLKGLERKKGNGDKVVINQPGEIIEISKAGDDIKYLVDVDLKLEHESPYGSRWTTDKSQWWVFHNADKYFYTLID